MMKKVICPMASEPVWGNSTKTKPDWPAEFRCTKCGNKGHAVIRDS